MIHGVNKECQVESNGTVKILLVDNETKYLT